MHPQERLRWSDLIALLLILAGVVVAMASRGLLGDAGDPLIGGGVYSSRYSPLDRDGSKLDDLARPLAIDSASKNSSLSASLTSSIEIV